MSTARKSLIATAVAVAVVVGALALWKIKSVIALLFVGLTISAALRPGVEWLYARRIPRSVGVLVHYLGLLAVIALLLWLIVPNAISQVQEALGGAPMSHDGLRQAATHSTGLKRDFLLGLDRRLRGLPTATGLIHPALSLTRAALKVLVATFFVFAVAAYWIFDRERAQGLVISLAPREHRVVIRETWTLIDEKLGAFVRGQLLMIAFVSTVLSLAFWGIGLPYWLLLGVFAGLVEMVPVVGPLVAGVFAVGVGATQSWHTAVLAAVAVYSLRLLQDYVINPHVLGHAVGLSPLIVLVTVFTVGILFGPFYVFLSVPLAAVLATLVDVVVRDRDPAKEKVPAVIFPAQEREAS
jgi:predicted PurR-regulated permease PerM